MCPLFLGKVLGNLAFTWAKGSIIVIELDKLLVFQDHGFGGAVQLFPEEQDFLFQTFNIRRCFFAPLPLMPCPHSSSALAMGLVPF